MEKVEIANKLAGIETEIGNLYWELVDEDFDVAELLSESTDKIAKARRKLAENP